jgi:hypothetical protein
MAPLVGATVGISVVVDDVDDVVAIAVFSFTESVIFVVGTGLQQRATPTTQTIKSDNVAVVVVVIVFRFVCQ